MRRLLAVTFVLLLAGPASAQADRYELARRLKAFEAAWEKHDDPSARKRAVAELQKVTGPFFTGQLAESARALDLAAFALRTDVAPSAGRQWAWSLSAIPEARVVDGSAKELAVTIRPFYAVTGDIPKGLELQLWFTDKQVVTVRPEKFPVTVKVPLPPLGEFTGLDRKLYFLADGGKELRPVAIGISQIADLQTRLDAMVGPTNPTRDPDTIEKATARHRWAVVGQGKGGSKGPIVPPTDLPYADLLANAETMLDRKPFFTVARHGQFWMSIPTGPRVATPCRVYVPKGLAKDKPVPVVVALHGVGGDENTFFESHGAGQIVKECETRGWVLVAPRSGALTAPPVPILVDALAERYPLDRKRVFVVGHSAGAAQALAQAASGKFAAVAALGGGEKVTDAKPFATLPVFIGVGDKDSPALAGARSLSKSLTEGGAKAVTFKEYPGVEQLVTVREALPDVFAVFDEVVKK